MTESEYNERLREIEEKEYSSYAVLMLRLQEMCGLTYREARAYLLPHRETQDELSKDLGISVGSVKNLRRRAAWKVQSSGFSLMEIIGRYGAVYGNLVEMPNVTSSSENNGNVMLPQDQGSFPYEH